MLSQRNFPWQRDEGGSDPTINIVCELNRTTTGDVMNTLSLMVMSAPASMRSLTNSIPLQLPNEVPSFPANIEAHNYFQLHKHYNTLEVRQLMLEV